MKPYSPIHTAYPQSIDSTHILLCVIRLNNKLVPLYTNHIEPPNVPTSITTYVIPNDHGKPIAFFPHKGSIPPIMGMEKDGVFVYNTSNEPLKFKGSILTKVFPNMMYVAGIPAPIRTLSFTQSGHTIV